MDVDKDLWYPMKLFEAKSTTGFLRSLMPNDYIKATESIAYDPLSIPPPVTLYQEKNGLKLAIRSDAFNPKGLMHFMYIFTEMCLTEMLLSPGLAQKKEKYDYPVFCFSDPGILNKHLKFRIVEKTCLIYLRQYLSKMWDSIFSSHQTTLAYFYQKIDKVKKQPSISNIYSQ